MARGQEKLSKCVFVCVYFSFGEMCVGGEEKVRGPCMSLFDFSCI